MDQIALVERFPGEDDEVFVPELQLSPGGSAANFAVMCSRLGAQAGFVGKVGDDAFGGLLIDDLKKEKVDTAGVAESSLSTGTVFIAVRKDGQRMMFQPIPGQRRHTQMVAQLALAVFLVKDPVVQAGLGHARDSRFQI